jgi:hypothetical protein
MEVSAQLHAVATLFPEIKDYIPRDKRLSGPHSWSGCGGKEKIAASVSIQPSFVKITC